MNSRQVTGRIGKDERNPPSPRQDVPLIISLVESILCPCVHPASYVAKRSQGSKSWRPSDAWQKSNSWWVRFVTVETKKRTLLRIGVPVNPAKTVPLAAESNAPQLTAQKWWCCDYGDYGTTMSLPHRQRNTLHTRNLKHLWYNQLPSTNDPCSQVPHFSPNQHSFEALQAVHHTGSVISLNCVPGATHWPMLKVFVGTFSTSFPVNSDMRQCEIFDISLLLPRKFSCISCGFSNSDVWLR